MLWLGVSITDLTRPQDEHSAATIWLATARRRPLLRLCQIRIVLRTWMPNVADADEAHPIGTLLRVEDGYARPTGHLTRACAGQAVSKGIISHW